MKAFMYEKYGLPEEVLQLKEVERPTPKDNEVLVKVYATAVNAADYALLTGDPFMVRLAYGLLKPKNKILGADIAGRVEVVGKNVKQLAAGDAVFGDLSSRGFGGFAEYVCVPENVLVKKPANLSFVEAAAVPMAALTALQGLRDHGKVRPGQKVVINGASGGVGTFAVQLAKHFGAEVTAVCSGAKTAMVRSLGADHVIDYTQENFTQNGKRYDLILAVNGYHPIGHYKRVLNPDGVYVATGGKLAQIFQAMLLGPLMSMRGKQKFSNTLARVSQEDLTFMAGLLESGRVTPVIDCCFSLNEVPQALGYVGQKHAAGKVIVTITPE